MGPPLAAPAAPARDRTWVEPSEWVAVAASILLLVLAAFLLWRRLCGGMHVPLSTGSLLVCALMAAATAAGLRAWWFRLGTANWQTTGKRVALYLPTAALVMLGAAVSLPGTSAWGVMAFWTIVLGAETASVLFAYGWPYWVPGVTGREATTSPLAGAGAVPDVAIRPRPRPRENASDGVASGDAVAGQGRVRVDPGGLAADVSQQITRRRDETGAEVLSGWLRVEFAAGQRVANLHVALCPPLPSVPRVSVQQHDGVPLSVKLAQVMPYGVRIELRRGIPIEEAAAALIGFEASCLEKQ